MITYEKLLTGFNATYEGFRLEGKFPDPDAAVILMAQSMPLEGGEGDVRVALRMEGSTSDLMGAMLAGMENFNFRNACLYAAAFQLAGDPEGRKSFVKLLDEMERFGNVPKMTRVVPD